MQIDDENIAEVAISKHRCVLTEKTVENNG